MPRKASKTDYVLDLLSGKEEEEQIKETKRKNIKVIDSESKDNNELSELIQDNLVKESAKTPKKTSKKAISEKTPKVSKSKKQNFNYVNVMEEVVKATIDRAVKQFDMCTCNRCMADVMALSLTNLPAKYVVTDQQVSPLLNYYSNKYNDIVNIELIKSCTLIKQYPHHNR